MLGVEDYGSDNESDNETQVTQSAPKASSSLLAKLPPPSKKSSFSLPPPSNAATSTSTSKSSNGLNLPAPKSKKAPKKITIGLPTLPADSSKDEDVDDQPPAKKPRIESGAGKSALLSMLPAPKNKTPVAPERVLGGGQGPGLVFKTASRRPQAATVEAVDDEDDEESSARMDNLPSTNDRILEEKSAAIPFLPPSLMKGKANISVEDKPELPRSVRTHTSSAPTVDFFSLGAFPLFLTKATFIMIYCAGSSSKTVPSSSKSTLPSTISSAPSLSSTPPAPTPASSSLPPSVLAGISSAPKIAEFVPPEPTQQDPYPGYYQLPNGSWAAYDPAYYRTFYDKWKKEYDAHVRALEKGTLKGFEGAEGEGVEEVNAMKEMEKAKIEIQEREERKELTKGAAITAAAPNMNIKV